MFVNRKTTKFSLCFTPIHPVCGPVRTPISNDVHSPVSSDAAVFSDGLHHEGGPLVVGGRLDAVAVLVARRQLEPLVADLYDGCLGVEDKKSIVMLGLHWDGYFESVFIHVFFYLLSLPRQRRR